MADISKTQQLRLNNRIKLKALQLWEIWGFFIWGWSVPLKETLVKLNLRTCGWKIFVFCQHLYCVWLVISCAVSIFTSFFLPFLTVWKQAVNSSICQSFMFSLTEIEEFGSGSITCFCFWETNMEKARKIKESFTQLTTLIQHIKRQYSLSQKVWTSIRRTHWYFHTGE